jgi:Inner membrane protein YgaP-like, transmembrane domain
MKKNIGGVDRFVRIVAGLGILSLVFIGPETKWGYLGLVPLATALLGWCPPYGLLGISTCKSCRQG